MENTLAGRRKQQRRVHPHGLAPPNRCEGAFGEGNHLSLKEQENVIDRIEKENFGLKLKIHFSRRPSARQVRDSARPLSKKNTDLKVDKVTMQRELQRYKKHLTNAEKDLESYRQQILEVQEKARRKFADENQRAEVERLTQVLEEKEAEVEDLQRQAERSRNEHESCRGSCRMR